METKIVKINCPKCKEKIEYNMACFGDGSQHVTHGDHCVVIYDSEVMKELESQKLVRFDRQNLETLCNSCHADYLSGGKNNGSIVVQKNR